MLCFSDPWRDHSISQQNCYDDHHTEGGIPQSLVDRPTIYIFALCVTIIMVLVMYSLGDLDRYTARFLGMPRPRGNLGDSPPHQI